MTSSNYTRYIGPIVIVIAIILMISGFIFFMSNFFIGPNVGMSFDEFGAAMDQTAVRAGIGMALLTIGVFSLMGGLCLTSSTYSSIGFSKFSGNKKIYDQTNPIIKGNQIKPRNICQFCQNEIEEGEIICHKCGTSI